MSKWSVMLAGSWAATGFTKSVPGAPGPPGLMSSEPILSSGFLAGTRASASLICFPDGCAASNGTARVAHSPSAHRFQSSFGAATPWLVAAPVLLVVALVARLLPPEHAASASTHTARNARRRVEDIAPRCHRFRVGTTRGSRQYGDAVVQNLLIGGHSRGALDGADFMVREPGTGGELTTVARAGVADVDAAVSTALAAFESGVWSGHSATARGRVLQRVAELLRERAETFAVAEARNAGKPIGDARWEVEAAAGTFEYFAGAANKHFGEVVPVQDPGIDIVLREPVGVCALIVPWNFPLLITSWKAAPALACGNPVIIKPASLTPVTALMLGELLVEAGVPEGCVSVLPGPGGIVGDALVGDPRVNKISFTGETTTGASILRASSDNITRVSLELGGKSACVVFADADWSARSRTRQWPSSATRARTAAREAGSSCSSRSTSSSSPPSAAGPNESGSACRSTSPPRWAR